MARRMTKTTEVVENNIAQNIEEVVEEAVEIRKYEQEELIPCKSLVTGLYLLEGDKSGMLYRWVTKLLQQI